MAIYDFHCKRCNKDFERMMKYSETKNARCCTCGEPLEKLFSSKMNFKLVYDPSRHRSSWGSEGYSTTQRNREKDGN